MIDKETAAGPAWTAKWPAALLLAFAVAWFCNLDYRDLVRPDEGRYAEIAREMAVTGDWVTPRLNGIKYFEKPPLQYWMTAAAYRAFGESEWTARLWAALTGFAGVLLTGFAGARLFGRTAGLCAAAVLAGSLLYAAIGHMNTLDMGLTFWLTAAMAGFLLAQESRATTQARRWMLLAWAAAGAAFLSKGLIGLMLPAMSVSAYVLLQRDFTLLRRMQFGSGIAIFLAISAPWIVAVSLANPEFARFFFIHEHFERFLTHEHNRVGAWWYFIPVLVAGLLPWTIMAAPAAWRAWKADAADAPFRPRRFLLLHAAIIFAFFSVSGSKLASYILPLFPAVALLLGEWLAHVEGRRLARYMLPMAALALAGLAVAPFIARFASENRPAEMLQGLSIWLTAGFALMLAACAGSWFLARRASVPTAVVILGCGGLLLVQMTMTGLQSLSPSYSAARAAQSAKPLLAAGVPFYSVKTYEHTLPFYIKRTVTLVDYGDELEFGLQQQPELRIASVQEFRSRWENDRQALAIMGPDVYRDLAQQGLPMRLLYQDSRRVIVARS
ncbi:MAG TPA: glycosyltransferase family 39 protein [Burkholderiales bacterium]|nr:glycosyltransferase family 39 protein [Burkholderiales bacterium]